MTILVTGGAGFIGTNFVLNWLQDRTELVVNIDALTYAGNKANFAKIEDNPSHLFVHGNICDGDLIQQLLRQHRPRAIVHFAAESHVDRSINGSHIFIKSNVEGTYVLLEAARLYWTSTLSEREQAAFRFLHVSTDEVYGSLGPNDPPFLESTPYAPNSPYAASKAAADHLVRAWHHTYRLPTVTTNCSNNFGPFQLPEKLVPLTIDHALNGKTIPIYGDGLNVRDWLYVEDHCQAICRILEAGRLGETYNIGGWNELTNINLVRHLCSLLDELQPDPAGPRERLVRFVEDRAGHDQRYSIDASKIKHELGWHPTGTFNNNLRKTVQWYLDNQTWVDQTVHKEAKNRASGSDQTDGGQDQ